MYTSIRKLEEYDWDIKKYLKEYAVCQFGLCVGLRDSNQYYSEEDLKNYFRGRDSQANISQREKTELPTKLSDRDLLEQYKESKDYVATEIDRATKELRDLLQIIVDIKAGLKQLEKIVDEDFLSDAESIAYNSLKTLKDNVENEIKSLQKYVNNQVEQLSVTFEEYRKDYEESFRKECERVEENKKEEHTPSNLLETYLKFVEIVDNLNI